MQRSLCFRKNRLHVTLAGCHVQLFMSNSQDGCGVFGVFLVEIVFKVIAFAALLVTAIIVAFTVMLVFLLVVPAEAAACPRLG